MISRKVALNRPLAQIRTGYAINVFRTAHGLIAIEIHTCEAAFCLKLQGLNVIDKSRLPVWNINQHGTLHPVRQSSRGDNTVQGVSKWRVNKIVEEIRLIFPSQFFILGFTVKLK
jgi:hypothetical protein